jgi:hypothetical protein
VRIEEPCYEGQYMCGDAVKGAELNVRPGRYCLRLLLLPLLRDICLMKVVLCVYSVSCNFQS